MFEAVEPIILQPDMKLVDAIRQWPTAIRPLVSHWRACGHPVSPTCLLRELADDCGIETEQLLDEIRKAVGRDDCCPWNGECLCR